MYEFLILVISVFLGLFINGAFVGLGIEGSPDVRLDAFDLHGRIRIQF